MHQLASRNIESVTVHLRDDENITMMAEKGLALMDYLTKGGSTESHVTITDKDGIIVTVNKHEIRKIVPVYEREEIDITKLEIPL